MKKMLSAFLTLTLLLGLAAPVTAFAESAGPAPEAATVEEELAGADAGDVTAPAIHSLKLSKTTLIKPDSLTVSVSFTEKETGVKEVFLRMKRKGSYHFLYSYYTGPVVYTNTTPGVINMKVDIPATTLEGVWAVEYIEIRDQAENISSYSDLPMDENGCVEAGFLFDGKPVPPPTFTVTEDIPTDYEFMLSNPYLAQRLNEMADGKTAKITVDMSSNDIFPKAAFDAIKGRDKTVVLSKGAYQWIMNGRDITKATKNINVGISISQISGDPYGTTNDIVSVLFAANGELPCKARIRLKSDYLYESGIKGQLYLYHYDGAQLIKQTGVLDVSSSGSEKWCYFDVTHNSNFFVSGQKLTLKAGTAPGLTNFRLLASRSKITLTKGTSVTVYAQAYDSRTNKVLPNKLLWSSSNNKVAKVSQTGKITGVKTGTAKIYVKLNKTKLTIPVTVVKRKEAVKVTEVKISGLKAYPKSLRAGRSYRTRLSVAPAKAYSITPKWKSSNTKVATVDKAGVVTTKRKGTAKISCTVGKKTKTIKIKVV